ncbi:hypothetical protein FNV43_RR25336 [Rhamnella rubrinervis]|uniref:Uncharacterized protein n=1 Tax=Rhamnella rubrinervis TaxID=2594499 RepID=A0A8K0GRI6_9ROSA|nr:hypothetical protein FNV43_RR25336 [Rhamnella rubrinervis]
MGVILRWVTSSGSNPRMGDLLGSLIKPHTVGRAVAKSGQYRLERTGEPGGVRLTGPWGVIGGIEPCSQSDDGTPPKGWIVDDWNFKVKRAPRTMEAQWRDPAAKGSRNSGVACSRD